MKFRVRNIIIAVTLFILEALIAFYVHDRIIRPYVGDILVVPLVYFVICSLVGRTYKYLWAGVFLFAAAVEILQYFQIVRLLNLEHCRAARIILGSTFDWKDLLCYGAGALLLLCYERWVSRKQGA